MGTQSRRRLTDADHARIVEMREAGRSYRAIGEAIGCSVGAIAWQCLRLGAEPPWPQPIREGIRGPAEYRRGVHAVRRFTPEEDVRLLELEGLGLSLAEIARRLGRRWNSVRGRLMTLARRDERMEASHD